MIKVTVGILLIVKNEQAYLADCLDTVKDWADDIVVVDSGSNDNTVAIASLYTNKVYIHDEWQGFGKQRQIAQSYLNTTWIFAIDADERVSKTLKENILAAVEKNDQHID